MLQRLRRMQAGMLRSLFVLTHHGFASDSLAQVALRDVRWFGLNENNLASTMAVLQSQLVWLHNTTMDDGGLSVCSSEASAELKTRFIRHKYGGGVTSKTSKIPTSMQDFEITTSESQLTPEEF